MPLQNVTCGIQGYRPGYRPGYRGYRPGYRGYRPGYRPGYRRVFVRRTSGIQRDTGIQTALRIPCFSACSAVEGPFVLVNAR